MMPFDSPSPVAFAQRVTENGHIVQLGVPHGASLSLEQNLIQVHDPERLGHSLVAQRRAHQTIGQLALGWRQGFVRNALSLTRARDVVPVVTILIVEGQVRQASALLIEGT